MRLLLFIFMLMMAACVSGPEETSEADTAMRLTPVSYQALPGWGVDSAADFVSAFRRSCEKILKRDPDAAFGPFEQAGKNVDWQGVCLDLRALNADSPREVQLFMQRHFMPYAVAAGTDPAGLFTGYYEASLRGSRTRQGPYQVPLHARPDDLVMVDLGAFREELKGQRIAGRVSGGNLKPYEERAQIVAGAWPHNDKVLVWVDDAVDAFFVQIQGSGVVDLAEGGEMRIGYAGQNGHPYYAIGRELIARGHLEKENVSMQSIRAWLEANPVEAAEIMNTNKSYVFFEEKNLPGALGAEGTVLTPERSLAVDRTLIPYGAPLWVDIDLAEPCNAVIATPANEPGEAIQRTEKLDRRVGVPPPRDDVCDTGHLQRLMVAQDTGGAITGAVRGDVFWGHGPRAETLAGTMKSQGQYWILLPLV